VKEEDGQISKKPEESQMRGRGAISKNNQFNARKEEVHDHQCNILFNGPCTINLLVTKGCNLLHVPIALLKKESNHELHGTAQSAELSPYPPVSGPDV
jgi:hypothetical protein